MLRPGEATLATRILAHKALLTGLREPILPLAAASHGRRTGFHSRHVVNEFPCLKWMAAVRRRRTHTRIEGWGRPG